MERGTLIDHDGRPAVRFRREFAHPAERLWAAITNPEDLARWFPSKVRMEPRAGGTIEFFGDPNQPAARTTGTILVFEPPTRLAYTWHASELHFTIEAAAGGGCVLTLTDVLDARDAAARNAAGWTVCLAELGKHLAGQRADGPHSDTAESWQRHYDDYVAAGMPSGAGIPAGG
ncbi:MAG TPA: SRPBCC family protein [Streptosporangiaceae bacterium]|nr:SRPBCC family protein [Streptosporangiaceae bacterium]